MFIYFFFSATATSEIYTLSLHDALPICSSPRDQNRAVFNLCFARFHEVLGPHPRLQQLCRGPRQRQSCCRDRKSTRLNSSHVSISYAVFCLKKKRKQKLPIQVKGTR